MGFFAWFFFLFSGAQVKITLESTRSVCKWTKNPARDGTKQRYIHANKQQCLRNQWLTNQRAYCATSFLWFIRIPEGSSWHHNSLLNKLPSDCCVLGCSPLWICKKTRFSWWLVFSLYLMNINIKWKPIGRKMFNTQLCPGCSKCSLHQPHRSLYHTRFQTPWRLPLWLEKPSKQGECQRSYV